MPDPYFGDDRWTADQIEGWRRLYPGESHMVKRVEAGTARVARRLAMIDEDGRPLGADGR